MQDCGPITHSSAPEHPRHAPQGDEQPKDGPQAQHRMKVGHHELRVMQDQVQRSARQDQPSEAATSEAHQEGHERPHRRRATRTARPCKAGQLAEHLHTRRDRHYGRGGTELAPRVHIQPHNHHVMRPHAEAHDADRTHALHHALTAEDVTERVRDEAKDGQDDNVHLRMPEEPEQVLLQDGIAPQRPILHARTLVAIQKETSDGHTQHRKRPHEQEGGDHQRPHLQGQHRQATMAPTTHSSQLVDGAQTRRQSKHVHAHQRQIRTNALRVAITSHEGRLQGPTATHGAHEDDLTKQRRHHRHQKQPLAQSVHARHNHLTRPTQHWQQLVAPPTNPHRHHEQEEHHEAMRADPPVLHPALLHTTHHARPRTAQLEANQQREEEALASPNLPSVTIHDAHQLMTNHTGVPGNLVLHCGQEGHC